MTAGSSRVFKAAMLAISVVSALQLQMETASAEDRPAKEVFGHTALPSAAASQPIGSYAKGCQSGAIAMPTDGPGWQAMRLSRNRRWGQPQLISFLERFSQDAQKIGWPGLLLGDISQPRGGPMLTGHASHQIGLDVDVWWRPMPNPRLSVEQRETVPFISMLDKAKFLTVDDRKWSPLNARLVMMAASYPQVERVFVNPAIKQKLCQTWTGDRTFMGKIRPIYGHDEHFHIRLECPPGAPNCKPQAAVGKGDGCDKSLAWWFTKEPWAPPKKDPNAKPVKPRPVMVSDLPAACAAVAAAPSANPEGIAAQAYSPAPVQAVRQQSVEQVIQNAPTLQPPSDIPLPTQRPTLN
ncbi:MULTISPECIES: penicillin-insensitive murein endopeptidase [Rhizobium/Agrobacterium group]|nr:MULTISPECIES: penicillin-insensitive murein endopeptidase [Rhizobium/Agrobacterium group]KRA58779.1 peptidase [Rhizobium sp. Root651]QCL90245.1 penicillin-insensitive murein endopeptidase [Agrobacterium tumefaciens]TKT60380.1 penicillin-insensitive murein endopeptidase [Agrobacterium sp. LC34]